MIIRPVSLDESKIHNRAKRYPSHYRGRHVIIYDILVHLKSNNSNNNTLNHIAYKTNISNKQGKEIIPFLMDIDFIEYHTELIRRKIYRYFTITAKGQMFIKQMSELDDLASGDVLKYCYMRKSEI